MKNRKWLVALALLLCCIAAAAVMPTTVAYIADRANTVRNSFRVEYLPPQDVAVPVRVHKTVLCLGEEEIGPEGFAFKLENLDTGAVATMTAATDGSCSRMLTFTAADAGKTYHYRLCEINAGREGVAYDETVYSITVSLQLDEQHEMYAVLTVDDVPVEAITAEFVNYYGMKELPDTGDQDRPMLWLTLLVLSAAGLMLLRRNECNLRRA